MRYEYSRDELHERDLTASPIDLLLAWLETATSASVTEPTAMCVSTVGKDGRPSARIVLLRKLDERGLTFFTNKGSQKGQELDSNNWVAATFWWGALERQVRVEGSVVCLDERESDEYFASRPRLSQLAAHASAQSQQVPNREYLEERMREVGDQFPEVVPRPANWGGYRIEPDRIEFWQGRRGRLHDRLNYRLNNGVWVWERLAP